MLNLKQIIKLINLLYNMKDNFWEEGEAIWNKK